MKTNLLLGIIFTVLLAGCNNSKGSGPKEESTKDSTISSFTDLSSTKDLKKILCQNWENKEDAEEAALSGGGDGLEMPYRGLSFFEDGSFVENPRDNIRFGKWTFNESEKLINVELKKGTKAQYKIVGVGPRELILMSVSDKKKVAYRADAKMQQQPADDPFYETNNLWRIKPIKAESDSAIRLRTEQCLLFYSKFLADNAGRGGNIISFVGLPSCFKWYRGRVSVRSAEKLEDKWINCYYNKEQALKAHAMLEGIISKKYKWNKEESNWVKQSADVVHQMYDTLRLL
jgi:hypothetical protein